MGLHGGGWTGHVHRGLHDGHDHRKPGGEWVKKDNCYYKSHTFSFALGCTVINAFILILDKNMY